VSENLDLVRSIYADWERGDYSRSDWEHPQIEYVVVDGPEPGRWVGKAEMAQHARGRLSVWERLRHEAGKYRELDDGRVLVLYRVRGRGKGSGAEVDQPRASLFHIEEGKVTRMVTYWEPDRALADLGLEEAMSQANVETVEKVIAALNRLDIDGYLACCSEDIQLRTPWAAIGGVYEGQDAIRRYFTDLRDTFDFRFIIDRLESIGADQVLAFLRLTVVGRGSGIPAASDKPYAGIYDFLEGKVNRIRIFLDRREALKAVGLEE
jgi:ketosteroid isomerase-like protein